MRHIKRHIVHCSDSTHGNVEEIRRWHTDPKSKGGRGWRDIGYHFVILPDGTLEIGRPFNQIGAHVKGLNTGSVGTCLIGRDEFDERQFATLRAVDTVIKAMFPFCQTSGHRDHDPLKTCPNFEVKDKLAVD